MSLIAKVLYNTRRYAPVAQLDRALVSGTKGRGFESLRVYQFDSTERLFYTDRLMTKDRSRPDFSGEPVGDAVHQLATDIHSHLMGELGTATDRDNAMQAAGENYPSLLFGTLAMHIAGVELKQGATAEERSAGVKEALRLITSTPSLYEQVTGARAGSGLPRGAEHFAEVERAEAEEAAKLRAEVAQRGYLSRETLNNSQRSVRLEYVTTDAITYGMRRRRNALPAGQLITIKLAPMVINWQPVKQYRQVYQVKDASGRVTGYRYEEIDYIGNRQVAPTPTLEVTSITPSELLPPKVRSLVGSSVGIGRISTGAQLVLEHGYTMQAKETVGVTDTYPHATETLRLPATLRQAYLGASTAHPLFAS